MLGLGLQHVNLVVVVREHNLVHSTPRQKIILNTSENVINKDGGNHFLLSRGPHFNVDMRLSKALKSK